MLRTRNARTVENATTGAKVFLSPSSRSPRTQYQALNFLIEPSGLRLRRRTQVPGRMRVLAWDLGTSTHVPFLVRLLISRVAEAIKSDRTQNIRSYLQKKYSWHDATIEDNDWHIHGTVLNLLPQPLRTFITKLIHDWLPTSHSLSKWMPNVSPTCPLCSIGPETTNHFLTCTHVKQIQHHHLLKSAIQAHGLRHRTDPHLL